MGASQTPPRHVPCYVLVMNSKPATENSKVHGSHPEKQAPPPKTGTPGPERSKTQQRDKDTRSGHDKDGNSQQPKR